MKRPFILMLCILISCILPIFSTSTADAIMQQMIETQRSRTAALDIRLTLQEEGGNERERRLQTLRQDKEGKTSTLTVFLSPESVRNTRFLSIEGEGGTTEQWIYLPSIKRIRRIAGTEESSSFMGSDFSYDDMASTTYETDQASHRLIGEDSTSYTVESIPNTIQAYSKTITIVDKETYLPLEVQFYEPDGKTLMKTLTTESIGMLSGRMVTKVVVMKTHASGHATRLEILQARFDIPLPEEYFTTKFLETGRL
ncbi:MAG: outer membrane lipoprotein-sorting protein [Sphaerochaetaceae bacterium]